MLIPLQNGNRDILSHVNSYLLTVNPPGILNAANAFQLPATTFK